MHLPVVCFATAAWLAFAAAASAQTYRWTDEHGVVTESSELPADISGVRQLQVLGGSDKLTALERRTLAIVQDELRRYADPALPSESIGDASFSDVMLTEHREPPIVFTNGTATETVQDPCLLSPDPRCHERHAADYHPYHGYAPSLTRAAQSAAAAPR